MIALGITASSNLAQRSTVRLTPGDTTSASGFTITYVHPTACAAGTYTGRRRGVPRRPRRRASWDMRPEFHQYPNQVQPVGEPAVWTTARGDDAYLSLLQLDEQAAVLHVYRYPWLSLIWIGGLLAACGGLLSLGLRLARRRAERSVLAGVAATDEVLA